MSASRVWAHHVRNPRGMFVRYVWADLVRNPRRTLSTAVGIMLGVGFSCAILFFVDGLSASMTQRAAAPLAIDMQLVSNELLTGDVRLRMAVEPIAPAEPGDVIRVRLEFANGGETPANEVIVRSVPAAGLVYVAGSAIIDGEAVAAETENPFASGPGKVGVNIGTVEPGASVVLGYQVTVSAARVISEQDFASTFSTREAVMPVVANAPEPKSLAKLVPEIGALDGVSFAAQLSFVDLPPGALVAGAPVDGLVRVFGFDPSYTEHDATIEIVEGSQVRGEAMISAEAAASRSVGVGDAVSLALPDGSQLEARVSGIVDLTRARSLFSSRKGANLESFIYVPHTLIVDSETFEDVVVPAFRRATTGRGERVKSPPVREIDVGVDEELLDAAPGVALVQTQQIASAISGVAGDQTFLLDNASNTKAWTSGQARNSILDEHFLLDNISNTLAVARDDAEVAKHMFVFLGVPGGVLAAMLAAYAGVVLAGAQRREQGTLRMRGASRRHLLSMLAMRVSCITAVGAAVGIPIGYATAAAVIGHSTLTRATTGSLVTSAVLGTVLGLLATGAALYVTGRRMIDREIKEERGQLWTHPPAWRRYRLDLVGMAALLVATAIIVKNSGFEGTPGSVYEGRSVQLPLGLLLLPVGAWVAGSLFGGRVLARILEWPRTMSSANLDRPFSLLYRRSLQRRPWATIILGMIVALGTSLALFTASYDGAKRADARYTVGSDLRITPSPANERAYRSADAPEFAIDGIDSVVPVVYGVHNVVLRSNRTEDLASLAALDPMAYARIAPVDDADFPSGSANEPLGLLAAQPDAILLGRELASFLKVKEGDTILVLLSRATSEQVSIEMRVVGMFERLPGFADGVDALINIEPHEANVASTVPAFFLAQTSDRSDAALEQVVTALRTGPGAGGGLQVDTRLTALAKDQSSLAALNIAGLLTLDSGYSLAMGTVTIAIFVFGLLLQRRREYVTLRAQGMQPRAIRTLIGAEASTVAVAGCCVGIPVGLIMAFYFINVLRPLFVLDPPYSVPLGSLGTVVGSVLMATVVTSVVASSLVNRLRATELLRDE
jgi:putative ABC transport system permease protein